MKFNKEALLLRLKEKTTWLGLAGMLAVYFGFEAGSGEQIAGLIASVCSLLVAED